MRISLFMGMLLAAFALNGQTAAPSLSELVARYQLDEAQTTEMAQIEARRLANMAEIEALRTSDYPLFLQKQRAIRLNTEESMRRMLRPEQQVVFNEEMRQRRRAESELIKEARASGRSKEEIEQLLLERGR